MYDLNSEPGRACMKSTIAGIVVSACVLLAGCASPTHVADTGVDSRSITSSVAARPETSVEATAFLGDIATGMDGETQRQYLDAQTTALETGAKTTWNDEATGASGSVEIKPSALAADHPGSDCRAYASVVWVRGNGQLVQGDACRVQGGSWRSIARQDPPS